MKKDRNSGDPEEGIKLWQQVTQNVKPYTPPRKMTAKAPSPKKKGTKTIITPSPRSKATPPVAPDRGFDRSTEEKLRRGQLPLEGRLDLHGMTQSEAFAALLRFINTAITRRKRTLLVITGKGLKSEGVLKRLLPQWLEDPALARHILALTPAQPKDGGTGAFYVRLRKPAREI